MHNDSLQPDNLKIDSTARAHLLETAKWARFLAIVGFFISSIMVLFGLFQTSAFQQAAFYSSTTTPASAVMMMFVILGVIYFVLSLFLFRFANNMKQALAFNNQNSLNDSFGQLKLMYKIMGIIVLVYIGFVVLSMIASIFA